MKADHELEEALARARPSLGTLRRLAPFLARHWRLALLPLIAEIALVASWGVGPHLFKMAIDDFLAPEIWVGALIIAALLLLNGVFQAAVGTIQRIFMCRVSLFTLADLRKRLFARIQGLSMSFFDRQKQGRIIARVDRDVDAVGQLVGLLLIEIVHIGSVTLMVVSVLAKYDWLLFVVVALAAPVGVLGVWALNRWGMPAYRRVRRSISQITANLAESVTGVHVVQAFGREEHNVGVFRGLLEEFRGHVLTGAKVRGITFPGMFLTLGLAQAAIIGWAGYAVPHGRLSVGEVAAALLYVGILYGPIMMLAGMYDQVLAASAAAERVVGLMDEEPDVTDRPGAGRVGPIEGRVAFEHVSFRYDNAPDSPWILDDVSFEAKPGEIVAIVGPTGSGKTTVLNLIPRFYEPQRGRITVDGTDIREVTRHSLHEQMGIVLQENFLFTGTVMDNLKYGRPEAADWEAVTAAQALGSHEIITRLADGYQTDVRERGGAVSHGERQLICFTRALLANPRILILDEATSAVDTETERIIQEALWRLMEGRTTFVVAHRLSTIRYVHKILVIQDGRIVEAGTHDELMRLRQKYADMFAEFIRPV